MWYAKYGIKPMNIDEEANLPEYLKQTRQNKIKIIDACAQMKRNIDVIELIARKAPELNDKHHAELVQLLNDKVNEARIALEVALKTAYGD